mgnify:CR=1 FL=1|tara:strand:+ start:313 stop:627 length:315 start_codon:yes stop_codon:yes gene_type:complete
MDPDVDVLDGEILREVQQGTLRIMQMLSKFLQWPTTKVGLLDEIQDELDGLRELLDETIPQDDEQLPALAQASQPMNFEQMAVATAWTGVREMMDGFFGETWRN